MNNQARSAALTPLLRHIDKSYGFDHDNFLHFLDTLYVSDIKFKKWITKKMKKRELLFEVHSYVKNVFKPETITFELYDFVEFIFDEYDFTHKGIKEFMEVARRLEQSISAKGTGKQTSQRPNTNHLRLIK